MINIPAQSDKYGHNSGFNSGFNNLQWLCDLEFISYELG